MPRRSNTFQDVVAIIHRHMADDATVEESAMLMDRVTGDAREVDAVARSSAAGYDVYVSVEATAIGDRADVTWVEQQIQKHQDLPTNQLVLVSQSGFTTTAVRKAESEGVLVVTPEALTSENPDYHVVSKIPSLWPKVLTLAVDGFGVIVEGPDGEQSAPEVREDVVFLLEDGTPVGNPVPVAKAIIDANFPTVAEQIGLRDIAEDLESDFTLEVGDPARSDSVSGIFLRDVRNHGHEEMHRVVRLLIRGKAAVRVSEIPLMHARLGAVEMAYGEGLIADRGALLVVTESSEGGKLTMRVRPTPEAALHPDG